MKWYVLYANKDLRGYKSTCCEHWISSSPNRELLDEWREKLIAEGFVAVVVDCDLGLRGVVDVAIEGRATDIPLVP